MKWFKVDLSVMADNDDTEDGVAERVFGVLKREFGLVQVRDVDEENDEEIDCRCACHNVKLALCGLCLHGTAP